jgi:hypothetical protein
VGERVDGREVDGRCVKGEKSSRRKANLRGDVGAIALVGGDEHHRHQWDSL